MAVENPGQSIAEVAQKMPAIHDLDRGWSAGPHTVGVGPGPVTGNDLHARMRLQPRRNRLRVAVGEQVDGAIAFQIDNDRAVALALAPGPIVDADDARCRHHRQGSRPDQALQGVAADRHGQLRRQAGAALATGTEGNAALCLGKASGAPNPRPGHTRQVLGEDAARAFRSSAPEATDLKIKLTNPPLPGEVAKAANVATMNTARRTSAYRAGRRGGASASIHNNAIGSDNNLINGKTGWE